MHSVLHWLYIVFRNKNTQPKITRIPFINMFDPIFMYLGGK